MTCANARADALGRPELPGSVFSGNGSDRFRDHIPDLLRRALIVPLLRMAFLSG